MILSNQLKPHFRRKNKKETIIMLIFLFIIIPILNGQDTVFIVPGSNYSYGKASNKTILVSWSMVSWKENTTYLQKRGTIDTIKIPIVPTKNNIKIGSYGEGRKAIIYYTGFKHTIDLANLQNVTIQNLEIKSPRATSCIRGRGKNSNNILIDSLILMNSEWGIRLIDNWSGIKILYTKIFGTGDDGIYTKGVNEIEIGHCQIYDVNKKYLINKDESYSGGDCIQISSTCSGVNIHDNVLDHSSTGNKFCIIVESDGDDNCIIENNTFIGSFENHSLIYLKGTSRGIIIKNNVFKDAGHHAIYSHEIDHHLQINNNKFLNIKLSAIKFPGSSNKAVIKYNAFYNCPNPIDIKDGNAIVTNNIFFAPPLKSNSINAPSDSVIQEPNLFYNL
ncbi:MAG: right-handed parallel beta-helix repeat-containing protein [bacterium]